MNDEYAGALLIALRRARRLQKPIEPELIDRLISFLRRRLTAAAKSSCHHCHEGERGAPCWWCGLRNR